MSNNSDQAIQAKEGQKPGFLVLLSKLWHLITTSRYTRHLETENARLVELVTSLEAENRALVFALGKPNVVQPEEPAAVAAKMPRRVSKFVGFSHIKKQIESGETNQKGA